jgi:16S rRNA (cytosine967-C5)-methyltransferase
MIKSQLVAADTVNRVLSGASLTSSLQKVWSTQKDISMQQRGSIQDLSYGVLRFYGQLDALLGFLLKKTIWNDTLRCLLLVGLYQLVYSRASPYAIVDNAVSASRYIEESRSAGGLVNAILRNFLRQKTALLEKAAETETARYSYPCWWIKKLRAQYPADYQTMLLESNQRPPMTLRVNPRRITSSEYRDCLSRNGIASQARENNILELEQPVAVEKLPGFAQGLVSVQDAGAQLAAPLLDVHDGMQVLDACAAPGGKSAHLLELADVELTAVDNDMMRIDRITQNLARLHLHAHRILHGDAAHHETWWDGKPFDRILADVPCSASGVTRRHPDIKWLRREGDIAQFAVKQAAILNGLWQMLNRGGKLLYVTCSVFAEENELQVGHFLDRHPDARLLPFSRISQTELVDGQLLPTPHNDGFYYALLHKV